MPGINLLLSQQLGFLLCLLDNQKRARGQAQFAGARRYPLPNHHFYNGSHLLKAESKLMQHTRCHPSLLVQQAEQEMLYTNVAMMQLALSMLGERQHMARPYGE